MSIAVTLGPAYLEFNDPVWLNVGYLHGICKCIVGLSMYVRRQANFISHLDLYIFSLESGVSAILFAD